MDEKKEVERKKSNLRPHIWQTGQARTEFVSIFTKFHFFLN